MALRMCAARQARLRLPVGSKPILVIHGIPLSYVISMVLRLFFVYAGDRLWLGNCSLSRIDYQQSPRLASGRVVETTGDIAHLNIPNRDEYYVSSVPKSNSRSGLCGYTVTYFFVG
ncbi:hypothetical protein [Candidatus Steffania adelgidicola]|uniref:hypothetical protein n=1 Tax=Candidatus Steffania adelgidicola TaxID=1076626 RepID=UPI003B9696B7